ncbi:unnamed protein product [Haemonchus placei]|uniref:Glutathione S-transferase omega n=1 Tax=Haemonchus placei TaxID=6290 RepID=A0A0N4WGB7_HAEPC|nr:unnamed protein product [Haemonchus placei]
MLPGSVLQLSSSWLVRGSYDQTIAGTAAGPMDPYFREMKEMIVGEVGLLENSLVHRSGDEGKRLGAGHWLMDKIEKVFGGGGGALLLFASHTTVRDARPPRHIATIIDSAVIAEYLDTLDPAKPILPTDPDLRSKQKKMAAKLEAKLPAAVHALINEQRFHTEKEPTVKKLHGALDLAEQLLSNTFYGGREPGFADYMTYPFVERIWIWSHEPGVTDLPTDAFPGASYPKLQRWFSLMRSMPEVKAVSQPVWRHRLFNQGYVLGNPDYDAGMGIRRHD